jgi:GWxTD domain-containing protein
MNKIVIIILLFGLIFSLFSQTPGKRETRYGFDINVKPSIYYTPFISYPDSTWKPHLNILLKVQNDILQFVKEGEKYSAGYEVLLTLLNQKTDSVYQSEIWRNDITVEDFSETNAKWIYQNSNKSFLLPDFAENLLLDVEVTDVGNFQRYHNRRPLKIQEINKDYLKISPITFFNLRSNIPSEIQMPQGDPIIEFNSDQLVRFSAKSRDPDTLRILSRLIKKSNDTQTEKFNRQSIYDISNGYLTVTDTISKSYLEEGVYNLIYEFNIAGKSDRLEKKFEVIWYNKPIYLYKFDLALRPMRYILSKKQWEEVDDLSYSEQENWFRKYWQEKDPSPKTPFNEIEYEFFSRVDDANREYSLRFIEGWETDRGKALILYGQPDRQEKKKYLTNSKPYEIWYYDSLKQKLTFVDLDNDANFKLVTVEDLEETDDE